MHRQEKREATSVGKLLSYDTNWPSRRAEGILYGHEPNRDLRRAYRHVDASRDDLMFSLLYAPCVLFFVYFPPYDQRGGGLL